jgi:quinol monooxygenase YgiN
MAGLYRAPPSLGAILTSFGEAGYRMRRGAHMGVIVIVGYRPKPGKEARLLELTREHVPILRAEGLASDRPAWAMHAADGTVIEVFEWTSKEAMAAAHTNPEVQKMWGRYAEACDYVPLTSVKECSDLFAGFAPIDLDTAG